MPRIAREMPPSQEPAPLEREPRKRTVVDQQRQRDTADCLSPARCPWCHAPLIVHGLCGTVLALSVRGERLRCRIAGPDYRGGGAVR